jgi:dolichol-phosphate mannosyltransferase
MTENKNLVDLSVIIPAYHEEENLRLLIPRIHKTLRNLVDEYEIIIVDTVTPLDNTEKCCGEFGACFIRREDDNTFGSAVRTGIRNSRGTYALFMDADGSHSPEYIPYLWEFREDYQVVIASRYVEGGFTENPKLLILMSKLLNWIYGFVLNLNCKDVSNSFKLYRAIQLKQLKLYCKNFDIVEEILFKLTRNNKGLTIKEVPFSFKKRIFGNTKRNLLTFMFGFLVTLIRLRFGK